MPKRIDPPDPLPSDWTPSESWNRWEALPGSLQAAAEWAWRNAGPLTKKDFERIHLMEGVVSYQEIYHHEMVRWASRLIAHALPWLRKEDRYKALGLYLGRAMATIRSMAEGGDRGAWKIARTPPEVAVPDWLISDLPKWIGTATDNFGNVPFVGKGGRIVCFSRRPSVVQGNRSASFYTAAGAWSSAGSNGFWRVKVHECRYADDQLTILDSGVEPSWTEAPAPVPRDAKEGWKEFFQIASPSVGRMYSIARVFGQDEPLIFPDPPKEVRDGLIKAWRAESGGQ